MNIATDMPSNPAQLKAEIRRRLRVIVARISVAERNSWSAAVEDRLRRCRIWNEASTILIYASMPEELDLGTLMTEALAHGKRVAIPAYQNGLDLYLPRLITDVSADLVAGKYGIREPGPHCPVIELKDHDLIIVPGVAFDLAGHRLGRGKGYYDRMLAGLRGRRCGVAFDAQVVEELPSEPHDIRMDFLATPSRWCEWKNR
jgi:5-formyltetrahydrofolate cyclo-ligase